MSLPGWFSPRTAAAVIALGLVLAPIAALTVAATGIVSIAASHGHPAWLDWFLGVGMRRSVQANAERTASPPLDNPDLIQLGAAHFQGGCAPCHAAPGELINPVFAGMLPSPPRLETHTGRWKDHELHWIVRNGLQYAGMPTWSGAGRDDEVWAIVAFLRQLEEMPAATYQDLARGHATPGDRTPEDLLREGVATMARTACDRCHDTASAPPTSGYVPRLGGQSEEYLARALREYRGNIRQSGFMEPIAAQLDDENIALLANHYVTLASPRGRAAPPAANAEGQKLAHEGDRARRIPACLTCHVAGRSEYPRLAGLNADYIAAQLRLFRNGGRRGSHYAVTMTEIAERLDDDEISSLAAHFESRPAGGAP